MYSELQNGLRDYLAGLGDFAGISVFSEAPPNTAKEAEQALKQNGIILVIGKPKQSRVDSVQVNLQVPIVIVENNEINASKLNISPEQVLIDLIVNLDGYKTQEFWIPAQVRQFQQSDTEFAITPWGVMFETKTLIVRSFAALSDHNGSFIQDEDGATFQTTNRGT